MVNIANLSGIDLEMVISDSYDNGLTIRETAYNIGLPVETIREFSKSIGIDWSGTETIDKQSINKTISNYNTEIDALKYRELKTYGFNDKLNNFNY